MDAQAQQTTFVIDHGVVPRTFSFTWVEGLPILDAPSGHRLEPLSAKLYEVGKSVCGVYPISPTNTGPCTVGRGSGFIVGYPPELSVTTAESNSKKIRAVVWTARHNMGLTLPPSKRPTNYVVVVGYHNPQYVQHTLSTGSRPKDHFAYEAIVLATGKVDGNGDATDPVNGSKLAVAGDAMLLGLTDCSEGARDILQTKPPMAFTPRSAAVGSSSVIRLAFPAGFLTGLFPYNECQNWNEFSSTFEGAVYGDGEPTHMAAHQAAQQLFYKGTEMVIFYASQIKKENDHVVASAIPDSPGSSGGVEIVVDDLNNFQFVGSVTSHAVLTPFSFFRGVLADAIQQGSGVDCALTKANEAIAHHLQDLGHDVPILTQENLGEAFTEAERIYMSEKVAVSSVNHTLCVKATQFPELLQWLKQNC
eukprot:TRINITY_DN52655_c0_g2_i2.p1 TRINITY_DN52655_c0_g2~~TRINITY_DN52655_c0_g2_i2.p1  ORF type:complete len:419 (-),score=36.55 TRINITY_DN52655_c0_g2_i2:39-1295(-)